MLYWEGKEVLAVRIDIVGGGSVGLLLAAGLGRSGAGITVVTRTEEQARRINGYGLKLQDAEQAFISTPRAVPVMEYSREPESSGSPGKPPDWILLTVKQKDITPGLLKTLSLRSGPGTSVCCFQNGIGHVDKLREACLPGRIYAAVTTEGARRSDLDTVEHTGRGITRIGEPGVREEPSAMPENLRRLQDLLTEAGFLTELSNCIDREIWNKLIMNAVINPLTAVLQVPNGRLLDSKESMSLMEALFQEAAGLADALGIDIAPDLWDRIVAVCRATERNRSSMLQDVEAGRRTELEWLNGSLLREAEKAGLTLPVHRTVYRLVRCKEDWAMEDASYREHRT